MNTCPTPEIIGYPSIPVITGAALVDSINPCAIAVILILLATLMIAGQKNRVLKTGFAFIAGLFIMYFIFGIGLFSALKFVAYAKIFHIILGSFAILVSLYFIKNFFWLPKDKNKVCIGGVCASNSFTARLLSRVTSPLAGFLAGVVVTFFELPCTGGPYIFALGYMASFPKVSIIPLLLYYNFLFILPLLVLTLLIYFGFSTIEKATAWKEKNIRILNLIAGLLMLGLGIWVLLN